MRFFAITATDLIFAALPFAAIRAAHANDGGAWSTTAKEPGHAAVKVQLPPTEDPPAHSGEVAESWESTVEVGEAVAVGATAVAAVSFLTPTTVVVGAAAVGGAAAIVASSSSSNSTHSASP